MVAKSFALLLVRLVVGVAFILHGWPKVQNPQAWMAGMENAPHPAIQAIAAFVEFGGGILLAVGLLTRFAALALATVMIGALALVHVPQGHPFLAKWNPGAELASVYLVVNLLIAITGAGAFSLDKLLFGRCREVPPSVGGTH